MRTWLVIAALMFSAGCDQIRNIVTPPPPSYDGAYLIIEPDPAAALEDYLLETSEQMAITLRAANIRYNGRGVSDGVLRISLVDAADTRRALSELEPISGHLTLTAQPDGVIEARINDAYLANTTERLAQAALPSLQTRLDRRVAQIEPYEPGRLIIRTTEAAIPDSVRDTFARQGQLTFHLVRESSAEDIALGRVPSGAMLVQPFEPGNGGAEIVDRRSLLTSDRIIRANPSTDPQTGEFVLSFAFDEQGKRTFCRITRAHIGDRFAILLDDRVITAPRINEPICEGVGQISGNFTAESANNLAMILRANALPAPFRIVEEHNAPGVAP